MSERWGVSPPPPEPEPPVYIYIPTIDVLEQNFKKKVYHLKPQFDNIKVGCEGEIITRVCYNDDRISGHSI